MTLKDVTRASAIDFHGEICYTLTIIQEKEVLWNVLDVTGFLRRAAKLVYPERCGFCGRVISPGSWICFDCHEEIEILSCDGSVPDHLKGMELDKVFCAGRYGGRSREGILRLKRKRAFNAAKYFCSGLYDSITQSGAVGDINCIAYVPMSRRKKSVNGYDQAEIIAGILARNLGKEIIHGAIRRTRTKSSQHSQKGYENRRKFAQKVYLPPERKMNLDGRIVLLCDDVITTGNSLSRCACILKEQGAKAVYAAALVSGK
jgi:competence protein ComFC